MPSADREPRCRTLPSALIALVGLLLAAGPLAGCATTYETAARLQLNSRRVVAAESATKLGPRSRTVLARDVTVVRGSTSTAVIVRVFNRGRKAVSDLPIVVGYRAADGRVLPLNTAAGGAYFDSHLPPLRAGQRLVWVLSLTRPLPRGAHVVALIGARPATHSQITLASAPLKLRLLSDRGGELRLTVTNQTGVEQQQLPLYAYVASRGRYAAAGSAAILELDAGATQQVQLSLVGRDRSARATVEAVPTILQ